MKKFFKISAFLLALTLTMRLPCAKASDNPSTRAAWMSGKYGLMVHWLFPKYGGENSENINKLTNAFDLDAFMRDFDATGAQWLIFTIGQNSGAYASPNAALQKYCGAGHSSERDLVLEIAKAIKKRGKKFIAYLPCEVRANKSLHDGLQWNDDRLDPKTEFQKRYTEIIREWSLRLGENCDGWWFDGCYDHIYPNGLNWNLWKSAYLAGNPKAIATFNPGVVKNKSFKVGKETRPDTMHPIMPDHDYLAGEVVVLIGGKIRIDLNDNSKTFMPSTAVVPGTKCLYHALLPIDSYWGAGSKWPKWANVPFKELESPVPGGIQNPVYNADELAAFYRAFLGVGGAVTFNLGITAKGRLSKASVELLRSIK